MPGSRWSCWRHCARSDAPAEATRAADPPGRTHDAGRATRRGAAPAPNAGRPRRHRGPASRGADDVLAPGRRAPPIPSPRPSSTASPRPGLHLIAEVKRRSPSAGAIAEATTRSRRPARTRPAARRRSRSCASRTGSAARSTTCGRSATPSRVPVLAKEFVVDPRQLASSARAGADLVLLLAALHPGARLRRLVAQARDLGLEPLVEAHDARELERALATRRPGHRHQQPRPAHARRRPGAGGSRCASSSPTTGSPSPSRASATRRRSPRWRATGFDGALVGEALMRARDPARRRRELRRGRPRPRRRCPASSPPPLVKICGVTDAAGVLAAIRAGADAIGLNFVAGHAPRADARRGRGARGPCARERAGRGAPPQSSSSPPTGRGRARRAHRAASAPTSSSSTATSRRPRSRPPAGRRGRRCGSRPATRPTP